MGINKVQYGNTVLIDLTDATATADKILQGYTAYGRDGSKLTGTATGGDYPDGNNLEYGFTDGSLPLVGIAQADYAHVWDDTLTEMVLGTGQIGTGRVV